MGVGSCDSPYSFRAGFGRLAQVVKGAVETVTGGRVPVRVATDLVVSLAVCNWLWRC
jgi:hypothetical protein